jgi:hypothetical protein
MFCLSQTQSVAQRDPYLQEMVEKIRNAPSLAILILTALQLGRVVAVKVVEEMLNERGQAPTKWPLCSKCGTNL